MEAFSFVFYRPGRETGEILESNQASKTTGSGLPWRRLITLAAVLAEGPQVERVPSQHGAGLYEWVLRSVTSRWTARWCVVSPSCVMGRTFHSIINGEPSFR